MTFFLITPPYLRKAESLPARERGLKQIDLSRVDDMGRVAPRAGAWIETA